MTTEFVSIVANQTVRSAMYVLKKCSRCRRNDLLYLCRRYGQQTGRVISLRDLIINDDDTMIADIFE